MRHEPVMALRCDPGKRRQKPFAYRRALRSRSRPYHRGTERCLAQSSFPAAFGGCVKSLMRGWTPPLPRNNCGGPWRTRRSGHHGRASLGGCVPVSSAGWAIRCANEPMARTLQCCPGSWIRSTARLRRLYRRRGHIAPPNDGRGVCAAWGERRFSALRPVTGDEALPVHSTAAGHAATADAAITTVVAGRWGGAFT